jgi:hypothetical protein
VNDPAPAMTASTVTGSASATASSAGIWRDGGMGEVIGLTTSQTARNVLAEAGVTQAHNTARFLGHIHGHREARRPLPVKRGSLLILDEASMMSLPDMAAILAIAHEHGCKVVVTGDHEQLTAVEGGGACGSPSAEARRHLPADGVLTNQPTALPRTRCGVMRTTTGQPPAEAADIPRWRPALRRLRPVGRPAHAQSRGDTVARPRISLYCSRSPGSYTVRLTRWSRRRFRSFRLPAALEISRSLPFLATQTTHDQEEHEPQAHDR